jgi:predicted amino acid racemase
VTIPLLYQHLLPTGITHFRVGETLYFGNDIIAGEPIPGMEQGIFRLFAEIIELSEKPLVPDGDMGTNVEGKSFDFDDNDLGKTTFRAIVDMGLLDVDEAHIQVVDENLKVAGASSDMIVIDLGANEKNYKVGDLIEFKPDYMATLSVLNSNYIEKKIV